jgi:hypothetical protein
LYPNTKVSIDAQTTAWAGQAHEFDPPMGIFIDAEWTKYAGAPANPDSADLRAAHDKTKAKYAVATTYTAKGYADTYLTNFDWSREELWVANYSNFPPALPFGATHYFLHQFTGSLDGKQLDPNGNAELDGSYPFSDAEFEQRYGSTGDIMDKYMKVTDAVTNSLNIRTSGENLGADNDLGAFNLLRGDIIHVIGENAAHFQRFDQLYRNGIGVELPTSKTGEYWARSTDGVTVWLADTTFVPPMPDGIEITFTENGVTKRYKLTGKWEIS